MNRKLVQREGADVVGNELRLTRLPGLTACEGVG